MPRDTVARIVFVCLFGYKHPEGLRNHVYVSSSKLSFYLSFRKYVVLTCCDESSGIGQLTWDEHPCKRYWYLIGDPASLPYGAILRDMQAEFTREWGRRAWTDGDSASLRL